ncbi:MAG: Swt1 family HEPN domain-containing protein [Alphaproteobacteria bacterium]|nr:Swt1 family HEPN domain-containing protein [Alphaproteobacteria bacterium]
MISKAQIYGEVKQHLDEVTKKLALFLKKILPTLFDDWWTQAVVNVLSFEQQNRLEQRGIRTLEGLDSAGLLRVLDKNWNPISNKLNLPHESRHFVKEMRTIRNNWAHPPVSGFSDDDIYRDLDTMQRFAVVIGADDSLIQAIKSTKNAIHFLSGKGTKMTQPTPIKQNSPAKAQPEISQEKYSGYWNKIISTFSNANIELHTLPQNSREPLWFFVYVDGNYVYVDKAKEHKPSSSLSKPRPLNYNEFEKMYPIYLRRKAGHSVSAEATAASQNQVYWYAIMDYCDLQPLSTGEKNELN